MRRLLATLPPGTIPVAAGVGIYGVASYVFLAIAGHALPAAKMAELSVLWSTVFALILGIFMPVEQGITRMVSAAHATGQPIRPLLIRAAGLVGLVIAVLVLVGAVFEGPMARLLYDGDRRLVWATVAILASYAVTHGTRGVLSGTGRFTWYGAQCAIDGVVRVVGAFLVASSPSATGFAWVLCVAPLIAIALTVLPLWRPEHTQAGQPTASGRLLRGTGMLIASGLISQVVANIAVVNAHVLSGNDGRAAVALLAAMVLVRIPIVVFGSMYAAMLASASAAVARGDFAAFRQVVARTMGIVTALAFGTGALCVAFGSQVSVLLFGAPDLLTRGDYLLLSLGTAAYLWAMVLGQAVLALGRPAWQPLSWGAGFGVLVVVTLLPISVTLRVELAYFAAMVVAAAGLAWGLARSSRSAHHASVRSLGGIPVHDAAH